MRKKIVLSLSLLLIFSKCFSQLLYPEPTDFIEIETAIEELKIEKKLDYDFPIDAAFYIDTNYISLIYSIDSVFMKGMYSTFNRKLYAFKFWTKDYKLEESIEKISNLYHKEKIIKKEIIEKFLEHQENYTLSQFIYSDRKNIAYVLIAGNGYDGYRFSLIDNDTIRIDYVFSIIE